MSLKQLVGATSMKQEPEKEAKDELKTAVEKIINKYADCLCSPWEDMQKEIFEVIDSERDEKALQNTLRLAQNSRMRGLNRDPMLSHAEELSRLYFVLKDTIEKMDIALEGAEDHPAELIKDDANKVRAFLKEADVLVESGFDLFARMSNE